MADPRLDAATAVLNDPTLQVGDIVMLADGPRVFAGGGKFEDVQQSKQLSKQARKAVLALTQRSLRTSGEAARKLALGTAPSGPGVRTAGTDVRVVYPGYAVR